MSQIIHYLGLDVHKDSIAVSIAPSDSSEVRRYGIINGSLDAIDKLIKKLSQPGVELRLVCEACPAASSSAVICAAEVSTAMWSLLRSFQKGLRTR